MVLIALIAVAAASLLSDGGSDSAPGDVADGDAFQPPVDGDQGEVPVDRIRVEASSFLEPVDGITYDPDNVIDGDPETAWNSASAADDGRGQTLTFRFTEPVDLRALRFVNGYAKNPDIYDANHRIRDILITTDGTTQKVSLLDTTERQEIAFDFGFTSKVELEVLDVYVGSGFNDPALTADLAVTEISFLAVLPEDL